MRIGINTLFLVPGDVGGTEIYLRENLKIMVSENREETFILFTSRDNEECLRQDLTGFSNVEFIQLPFRAAVRFARILFEQILLPWLIRRRKVDVLWSPGYTAPLFCSCPQAVTIHDLQYKTHPDDVSFLERVTLDFLVKNACRKCDKIIAVSQFSKNELLRFNFATDRKVAAILEGVDSTFGEPPRSVTPWFKEFPQGTPYILCVAHSYPHKQVHLLVEAFALVTDKIPHHLVLVGKPRRGEQRLQKSLDRLRNDSKVHRISQLQYSQLQALYQNADIFVLPSVYEGFGLPVLEAMLAGVPVIASNKASLPEVGGVHALYVQKNRPEEFARNMLEVVSWSQSVRREKIQNAFAWASSFTWTKSAERTLQVLAELVQINRQG